MADNLVIVESPAKAGTIGKYLGADYEVKASMGHIRDLPSSKLGVDVENHFEPSYIIPIKAKKTVTALKAALKGKKRVLLATDLDREGEAIAWHIAKALDLENQPGLTVQRITFDEITKTAIQAAVLAPRDVDINLVDAQQARRVLDRLVGYTLSPILWKKLYKGLSAGRVQSVALRLVVERERERTAFQPVEYWSLDAWLLNYPQQLPFKASLSSWEGTKISQLSLSTKEQVDSILAALEAAKYTVSELTSKRVKRRPSAPYTTSTFQQDGVNKLGLSSKRVMQLAQGLYEAGLITYMRTDSVSLASTALDSIREHISSVYGVQFVPDKPNFYKAKTKGAQEAHEAIRPTNPALRGSQLNLDDQAAKVYDLIRKRTVASQMKDAELEQSAASIAADKALFRVTGQRIIFPGFLEVWGIEDNEENILPELSAGQVLSLQELKSEQHFTEPPPRFSEATLIKELEELGIGRPSTYAPTIGTLVERNYVITEQRRLVPQEAGFLVTDLLVKHFPDIVDSGFTASMEERLDQIAEGQANYESMLSGFWKPFSEHVMEESENIEKVETAVESDVICPTCGAPMLIKMGRFGKFLACSKFPDCKTTQPLNQAEPSGLLCPHCGNPFAEKRARMGVFYGCSNYPTCKVALWKKEYLPSKIAELEVEGVKVPFKEQALAAFAELGIEAVTPRPRVPKAAAKTATKPASKTAKKTTASKAAVTKTTASKTTKTAGKKVVRSTTTKTKTDEVRSTKRTPPKKATP